MYLLIFVCELFFWMGVFGIKDKNIVLGKWGEINAKGPAGVALSTFVFIASAVGLYFLITTNQVNYFLIIAGLIVTLPMGYLLHR